jgi:hypothetical protein
MIAYAVTGGIDDRWLRGAVALIGIVFFVGAIGGT